VKEIMEMDLQELNWYYERLRHVKEQEFEVEKIKFEALLTAMGVKGLHNAASGRQAKASSYEG
jgi:hypothetical protein